MASDTGRMPRICYGAVDSRRRGQDSDVGFVVQQRDGERAGDSGASLKNGFGQEAAGYLERRRPKLPLQLLVFIQSAPKDFDDLTMLPWPNFYEMQSPFCTAGSNTTVIIRLPCM